MLTFGIRRRLKVSSRTERRQQLSRTRTLGSRSHCPQVRRQKFFEPRGELIRRRSVENVAVVIFDRHRSSRLPTDAIVVVVVRRRQFCARAIAFLDSVGVRTDGHQTRRFAIVVRSL
jgi:hypothetical protein